MAQDFVRCYKCGYETTEALRDCPKCGRRMISSRRMRGLGWAQLLIGIFLVGFMGAITLYLAPTMLQTGTGPGSERFTGTPAQALMILLLLGVVIFFGVTSIANGLWQIKTGRRNKWILIFSFAVFFLLIVIVSAVRTMLG